MVAQDVIIKPIITEKSMAALSENKYTFKVAKNANKIEIAKAVEELFDVQVKSVNTMNCRGRMKRMGMNRGMTPSWKKAIVTLTPESKSIEFFDSLN